ncbi:RNA-binding protein 28 [Prunus yedoensis var. nudiflora]|uniref:RNA-binding protein 28 n=1 Tax=Prunus yedoensis var. nudiflora TaxID=2094558 RepID=A0A314UEG8_PRUYE|nr:RNA-binding protein 28 [Prunus yedoensis var. nudiflora]
MGKNKSKDGSKTRSESEHSASTVFVSNLPYSFTNSEVRMFLICLIALFKGSTEHRGFGYVQFAVTEDANRAIELKNGVSIGGRKIAAKHAMHRAPLEQRRSKTNQGLNLDDTLKSKNDKDGENFKAEKDASSLQEREKPVKARKAAALCNDAVAKVGGSEKQRVARTVIFGGLVNAGMAEEVHRRAREIDAECSITYPLPKEKLEQHGLMQDGCKMDASSVLYNSVKSAHASVATLHQKEIKGGIVWARQLGGEGAKTRKWKLIVRNIPFKAKENEIKEIFSSAGFVWDVIIPHNSDTGLPKGFAFVQFTRKQDAEMYICDLCFAFGVHNEALGSLTYSFSSQAIKKLNGQMLHKRPIAVDWALSKQIYGSVTVKNALLASDDGQKDGSDGENDSSSEDLEGDAGHFGKKSEHHDGIDSDPDNPNTIEKKDIPTEINFEEEVDIARKVLKNLIAPSAIETPHDDLALPQGDKEPSIFESPKEPSKPSFETAKASDVTKPEKLSKSMAPNLEQTDEEDDLHRTIFISNLPFDINNEDVKQRFSTFGELQSFFPVLHPVTKRPKGTGFLKFKTKDAASSAVSVGNAASGPGISLKGRQLTVLQALDKKSAHDKESNMAKKEDLDRRNLYLAKEGLILEGTPAAEGVSASDMLKRQMEERSKMMKLQSPNFHVSKTRIFIKNLPKSMTAKELKKLCIDAVTSRATKQKPVIQQIKFLEDVKKGKLVAKNFSRGAAFVEFTEHQHALVALRVLNNNPETFGPEHRPIVEFALENVKKLNIRNAKIQAQQHAAHRNRENVHKNEGSNRPDTHPSKKSKNSKQKGEKRKLDDSVPNKEEVENKFSDGAATERQRGSKRQKNGPFGKEKKISSKESEHSTTEKAERSKREPNNHQDGRKAGGGRSSEGETVAIDAQKSKPLRKTNVQPNKRKLQEQKEVEGGENVTRRQRPKKNKDPLGRDVTDKLDMLIEQYRSKYSQRSSVQTDGEKQGSRKLRKWFQT